MVTHIKRERGYSNHEQKALSLSWYELELAALHFNDREQAQTKEQYSIVYPKYKEGVYIYIVRKVVKKPSQAYTFKAFAISNAAYITFTLLELVNSFDLAATNTLLLKYWLVGVTSHFPNWHL